MDILKRFRIAVCCVTILACFPYLVLKAQWLLGFGTGATGAAGAAELLDLRHIVGDVVTGGMELVAIVLVSALTFRWGRRLPAVIVLLPVWIGTGLLVPIALGLPLGLAAQAVAGGSAVPAGNGLQDWVYAAVYGGFVVQAVGLLAAFPAYAYDRWPAVFARRTASPSRSGLTIASAVVAIGCAAAYVLWAVAGTAAGGPAGFETVTQRTLLFVTGTVIALGAVAVLRRERGRLPVILGWIGTAVAVAAGPTQIALSNHGSVCLPLIVVAIAATAAGLWLAGSAIRTVRPELADERTPRSALHT